MGVLNFIAGLAAIILAFELLIATLLFAALCGGLWFGLNLGNKKLSPLFVKANTFIEKGQQKERKGLRVALTPLIKASAVGTSVAASVTYLRSRLTSRGRP